jgi:hypothetical protein
MGVVADIGRSWFRGPRAVVREHIARGPGEGRAFGFLMIGSLLVVVAQLPALSRDAAAAALGMPVTTPLARSLPAEFRTMDVMVTYTVVPWLVIAPLVFFGLAFLAHLISRGLGGQGTAFGARIALFWSWLAASPLALLTGLMAALAGPLAANVTGILWVAVFGAFWWVAQQEAAQGTEGLRAV